ncbi:MAG: hypothetical protein CR991_05595 [Proteobacteria bacterium]|nr:MAG: hypothetical protein CR991_05595 [Pseudomonadota bacterium]
MKIYYLSGALFALILYGLSACSVFSEEQQAREVAQQFWAALVQGDMETAKKYATWDSVRFLPYLQTKQVEVRSAELGEWQVEGNVAQLTTILRGGEHDDLVIPAKTILIRQQDGWLVDVQQTLTSMVSGTMGAVVDQLNGFMQQGLEELDKALSDSVEQLNESLQNGLNSLPFKPPKRPPETKPPIQQTI